MVPEIFCTRESRALGEVLDDMRPFYENPFTHELDMVAEYLAYEILDAYFDVPQQAPTFADKAKRRVIEERIKGYKRLEKLREQRDRRIEDITEQSRERLERLREEKNARIKQLVEQGKADRQRILERERQRRKEAVAKVTERFQAKEQTAREKQKARVLKDKIKRRTNRLSTMLLNPTHTQHIPTNLQAAVAEFWRSSTFHRQEHRQAARALRKPVGSLRRHSQGAH